MEQQEEEEAACQKANLKEHYPPRLGARCPALPLASLREEFVGWGTVRGHGVQGGVPLVGLPQAGELQLVVAAVALQLSLPAQSVQKGPSFLEGPHRQQEQGPQWLEPQLAHGLWVAQQLQWEVWAGSLGAGLVAVAAAAGASAGSAAVGPSSRRTSAAPCGRLVGLPGAVASGTLVLLAPGP